MRAAAQEPCCEPPTGDARAPLLCLCCEGSAPGRLAMQRIGPQLLQLVRGKKPCAGNGGDESGREDAGGGRLAGLCGRSAPAAPPDAVAAAPRAPHACGPRRPPAAASAQRGRARRRCAATPWAPAAAAPSAAARAAPAACAPATAP
ncbi:MAG: hypothetical protein D6824_04225 [Planctomycetota bacterium]|nr:MAG: hypothetical protein D6824_04225 [Planctomycetota bacterium]